MIAPMLASRGVRRSAFVAYALLLVTLTHWPRLAIESPGGIRLDIFIHAGVFGAWTVLLAGCAFFGDVFDRRNIALSGVMALAYALVDELTQGIPGLGRTVDPADLVANSAGILIAFGALWLVASSTVRRADAP